MNYGKRNYKECGEVFTPKGANQHGVQKYCSEKCNRKVQNRRQSEKRNFASRVNSAINTKNSFKQEINNIYQPLYQVKKGANIIKKLDKIHEDLVNYIKMK